MLECFRKKNETWLSMRSLTCQDLKKESKSAVLSNTTTNQKKVSDLLHVDQR